MFFVLFSSHYVFACNNHIFIESIDLWSLKVCTVLILGDSWWLNLYPEDIFHSPKIVNLYQNCYFSDFIDSKDFKNNKELENSKVQQSLVYKNKTKISHLGEQRFF